ncbi:flagellar motor protein MotB [Pedobacter yonginense]|uniref:Flagellar motor protein MotB n=1 Tax=Pedobacter yonginense TaxID=651869 RepID=A0A317EQ03_9SPHI|nr:OmpA family protein [Pedobacter yonginense]PWS28990.1 flagellar motor protein MotB [Pedobacter yonginense]
MNSKITKSTMLIALLGLSSQLFAQETPTTSGRFGKQSLRTWSVGAHGGILSQNTFLGGGSVDAREFKSIGYGAFVKKQILPALGLQADFLRGDIKTANYTPNGTVTPTNLEQKNSISWSGSLTAVLNIANFSLNTENAVLIPYVKAGAGYMSSDSQIGNTEVFNAREGWFIPTGVGFKFGVSKGINIDLGYDINFIKSSPTVKNAYNESRFSYAHAGLEFALGNKENSQLQNYSAVADLRKQSAEESAELRRALSTAEQNAQRDRDQYAKDLADDDNDGVANKFDKCPGTPSGTVVDGSGCPLAAPTTKVIKETTVITEADRKVVRDAISNLEFDLGKSTIRSKSNATLDRVANLLIEKNFSLKLAGHTDNTGGRELNLRLSKDRAEAVKAYLVSQGANASRIEATGYGPDQPIATNKTAAGRQQNRRVEFTLY